MTIAAPVPRHPVRIHADVPLLAIAVMAACFAAAALVVMGMWAIALIAYTALGILGLVRPQVAILIIIVLAGGFEAGAVDFTGPIGDSFQATPPALQHLLPITVSPFELVLLATAVGAALRRSPVDREPLPAIIYAVPLFIVIGWLYGYHKGAEPNLMYHEARGLIFGAVAFFITLRMNGRVKASGLKRAVVLAALLLAVVVLVRYLFYVRTGQVTVRMEFAFAHEDAILLGLGFVACSLMMLNQRSRPRITGLMIVDLLIVMAMLATARRSATLVLLVAILVMGILLFPKRPWLVVLAAVPVLVVGPIYLAAYWDQEYGATAQPARAIRSQIDPSPRDDSSDQYREIEAYNVTETIRLNRLFGVGFGRPFGQFQQMPDLTGSWPLQWFSPHNNILWLWLKMGIFGAAVALSAWVLALKRSLWTARELPRTDGMATLAILVACGLMMYLTFARVDLALLGSRSSVPLGCLMALAFLLPRGERVAK